MLTYFLLFKLSSFTLFGRFSFKMPFNLLYSVLNLLKCEYFTRIEENTDLISDVKGNARFPGLVSNDKPWIQWLKIMLLYHGKAFLVKTNVELYSEKNSWKEYAGRWTCLLKNSTLKRRGGALLILRDVNKMIQNWYSRTSAFFIFRK